MAPEVSSTEQVAARTIALRTPAGDEVVLDMYGPPGAPAVLFVSGAGPTRAGDPGTSETARLVAAHGFQASFHDRVGRGDSAAQGPISLDRELAAIGAIADELAGPVVLVGHSSGCAIALLAARVVNRLAGLVLWEGPFGQFEGGAPAWWGKVDEDMAAGRLEGAVADYMVGMPPEWLEAVKRSPGYPHLVLTWIPDGEALARVEAAGFQETLRGIDVPVLAVVGTETFPGMKEAADQVAAAAARGASEAVQGAWHSWDPAAMATRLVQLLRQVAGRA